MHYLAGRSRSRRLLSRVIMAALAAIAVAGCGDDDEPPVSPTAAVSATVKPTVAPSSTALGPGGGGEPPGAATVADPSPLPTVTRVPGDWATFTQDETSLTDAFSFRYPKGWFVDAHTAGPPGSPDIGLGIILTPWDPSRAPVSPPPGSLKVDIAVGPAEYTCGGPDADASATASETLDALPAKRLVVDYPEKEGELVRSERVWVEQDDRLYCIAAYHTGPLKTEETFATLLHSFEFTK